MYSCSPSQLLAQGACFQCLDQKQTDMAILQLLCEISQNGGGGGGGTQRVFHGPDDPNGVVVGPDPAIYYSDTGGLWVKLNGVTDDTGWAPLIGASAAAIPAVQAAARSVPMEVPVLKMATETIFVANLPNTLIRQPIASPTAMTHAKNLLKKATSFGANLWLLILAFLFFSWSAMAQFQPPLLRNILTTNQNVTTSGGVVVTQVGSATVNIGLTGGPFQPAGNNLTNWNQWPTNILGDVRSITILSNAFAGPFTNASTGQITTFVNTNSGAAGNFQPASNNLTNWSGIPTNILADIRTIIVETNTATPAVTNASGGITYFLVTNASPYAVSMAFGALVYSPADNVTNYIGNLNVTADVGSSFSRTWVYAPVTGTITGITFSLGRTGTTQSGETWPWSVRIANTTDYSVGNLSAQSLSVTGLSIPVTRGQSISMWSANPAWVTNPTSVNPFGTIVIEVSP